MKTAYATIKGFEVMRMFKKGQFAPWIDAIWHRGALHPPPVRPLCLSYRRAQAFTRRDRIFATVPDKERVRALYKQLKQRGFSWTKAGRCCR
jgi:hypothetical protein